MNEIVREDPQRTAIKIVNMASQISELNKQLDKKNAQIAKFQSEAVEL